MAHNLFGERFYGNRIPAWHRLGIVSQQDESAIDVLKQLGDYTIEKRPVFVTLNGQNQETGDFALIRSATKEDQKEVNFGYCTKQYAVMQPKEIAEIFDDSVKQPVETMGMLGSGEKLFLTWKLPDIDVKSDDKVQTYGFVASGYDGKFGSSLSVVTTRVVCQNTFNIAINEGESQKYNDTGKGKVWSGRHNSSNMKRDLSIWMEHVQEKALRKSEEIKESLEAMALYSIGSTTQLADILFSVYNDPQPLPADYPSKLRDEKQEKIDMLAEKARNDRYLVEELFNGAGTQIDNTMWGLFNSITEYENWGRMTKKPAEYSIVMGNRANTMAKAYNVITSYIQKQ
jgi:phage/plasmid-like protein (TIGR03299 family)